MTSDQPTRPSEDATVESLLSLHAGDALPAGETAMILVEVYEGIERVYRAAALSGSPAPTASASTNSQEV